jgi:hypothetical protein
MNVHKNERRNIRDALLHQIFINQQKRIERFTSYDKKNLR